MKKNVEEGAALGRVKRDTLETEVHSALPNTTHEGDFSSGELIEEALDGFLNETFSEIGYATRSRKGDIGSQET